MTSIFGASRSSKRRNTKNEEAKKEKRLSQMNALLDNGKVKLERENRMDKISQENKKLMRDEFLHRNINHESEDEDKSCNDYISALHNGKSVEGYTSERRRQPNQKINYKIDQPKDANETSCLGSRNTLQFSRVISVETIAETLYGANDKEPLEFTPLWFGLHEALTDLQTILLADQQQYQFLSSFASLREELLRLCSSKSTKVFPTYLRKRLLCKQEDQERIRRIPVDVLRWLMALACGPIIDGYVNCGGRINQNKFENLKTRKNMKEAAQRPQRLSGNDNCGSKKADLPLSPRLLMEAQNGAYHTLYRLWSQHLGFPLQQQQKNHHEIYLLSISALPRQLHQWFGSSFPFETASRVDEKSIKAVERDINILISPTLPLSAAPLTAHFVNDNNGDSVRVTSTRTALVRFLQLWALSLQKQNINDNMKNNVHLVHFHYDRENRARFRQDIADAIMAVLWAGLHPSFASSRSRKDDGKSSTQTIVACLLDRVRREDSFYNFGIDDGESFGEWQQTLSESICRIWSQKLGRGQRGSDAFEDKHAWLCLARSVTSLTCADGNDYKKVGGIYSGLVDHGRSETINISHLKDFQLSLCRSILKRAFGADPEALNSHNIDNNPEININISDRKAYDWVSGSADEEMRRMEVPTEICSSQRWQAMALTFVGLSKLVSCFPEEEPGKCFALMDICTICFQSAIVEQEHKIQKYSVIEKRRGFDDNYDVDLRNNNATTITSYSDEQEVLEKHALYNALVRLESASEIISNRTRSLIMQNICFPWASHMAESLRNYARSQKGQYAPPSVTNGVAPLKQQSRIISFFESKKGSSKLITN